jgi:hypothetical protein
MGDYVRVLARARARSAARQWAEAAALWEQVVEANPVHGNHWDSLAEARYAAGDHAGALAAYEKVAGLGVLGWRETVYPAEVAYRIARCHARLGDADAALAALGRALDLGYRDLDGVPHDADLASLGSDGRLAELLGIPEVEGLSRAEGWRADLRFFAREVKRRAYRPPGDDFDAAVSRLSAAAAELSDAQLLVELGALLRTLHDGHAYVEAPDSAADLHRSVPVRFGLFTDGLYVTAAVPARADLLGARVVAFDGNPSDAVVDAVVGTIGWDNTLGPLGVVPWKLCRPALLHALGLARDPGAVALTVHGVDGATSDVTLAAESFPRSFARARPCPPGWRSIPASPPLYLRNCGARYWYTHQPADGLTYVQLNTIADDPEEPLEAFVSRLFDHLRDGGVGRLVLDLRWNGGGNTFLTPPLVRRLTGYGGELFVIIGRHTFSAAQNLCVFIADHARARFVGEPTGSSPNFVGETVPFRLPYSDFEVNVSDLYWQTSWPMDHRSWLPPDIYAPPTFEAYAAGRDPAMDAILDVGPEHVPGW